MEKEDDKAVADGGVDVLRGGGGLDGDSDGGDDGPRPLHHLHDERTWPWMRDPWTTAKARLTTPTSFTKIDSMPPGVRPYLREAR